MRRFRTYHWFQLLIPRTERMNIHLDYIGIEGSAKHGGHQPDVFRVQVSLEGTKQYCANDISTCIGTANKTLPALLCMCVCYLRSGSLQNAIGAFRAHALYNPGPQSLFDEANVRQQLSKLSLQTGDLLHTSQQTLLKQCTTQLFQNKRTQKEEHI